MPSICRSLYAMNFRLSRVALALVALSAAELRAQSVWSGGGITNTNWSDSANWIGAPTSSYSTSVDFNLSLPFTSTLDSNFQLNSLTIGLLAGPLSLVPSTNQTLSISSSFTDSSISAALVTVGLQYTMDLVVNGTGTLTLGGTANTYTGTTLVTSGTLADNNAGAYSSASGFIIGSGGTLDVNHTETVSYLDNYLGGGGSVVIVGGATLLMNGGFSTTFPGVISGAGGLEMDTAGTLTLTGANTYTGATVIGTNAAIQIGSGGTAGSIASSSISSPGTGDLSFDLSSAYTYAGALSGSLGVVQHGAGTTTLSGTNTYSGATTVNAGTLQAGSTSAFGGATGLSQVNVANGATLDLGTFSNTVGSILGGATSSITLGTGSTLTLGSGASTVFNGVISGPGALSTAEFALNLTNANTYSGGTTITGSGDTLVADNATGSATGTGPINIGTGASLLLGQNNTSGFIDSASAITDNGTLEFFQSSGTYTIANNIDGSGGVSQAGAATVVLSGTNPFTGTLEAYNGILRAGSPNAFGNGMAPVTFPYIGVLDLAGYNISVGSIFGGASGGGITLGSGNLTIADPSSNATFSGYITGTGSIIFGGASLVLNGTSNTYSGGTTVANGTLVADNSSGSATGTGAINIGSGASLQVGIADTNGSVAAANITDNGALILNRTDATTFSSNISGIGAVVVAGGVVTLAGSNSYSGGTTLTGGSEIFVDANNSIGTGTLTMNPGTELSPNADVTLANSIVLSGGAVLDNDDGGSNGLTLTGLVSEAGGTGGIEWCTTGILALTNANTFTGGIDMREGTLLLGTDTSAGSGGIILDTGTTLSAYAGPGAVLSLGNNINFTGSFAQLGNSDDNQITLNGGINGGGTIIYQGGPTGSLTLSPSANTFSGNYAIGSGTVYAANNNAFGSSANPVGLTGGATLDVMSGVTVNNPLTFSGAQNVLIGSGTIGSAVTVDSHVMVAAISSPGNGPGHLTFNSGLTLANGGEISFDLYDATGAAGTGFSLISANAGIDITAGAGSFTFNLFSTDGSGNSAPAINFNPASSYSWTFALASPSVTGFNANEFNINTAGFTNGGGGTFSISGTTNDLVLNFTPVPEPSTWAMIAAGSLAVATFGVRRRRLARV
jgi:fibronectin-binding autotransporter adhesin